MPASASRRRTNCSALSWIKPARREASDRRCHPPRAFTKADRGEAVAIALSRHRTSSPSARNDRCSPPRSNGLVAARGDRPGCRDYPASFRRRCRIQADRRSSILHLLLVWCVTNWAGLHRGPRVQAGLTVRAAVMPAAVERNARRCRSRRTAYRPGRADAAKDAGLVRHAGMQSRGTEAALPP